MGQVNSKPPCGDKLAFPSANPHKTRLVEALCLRIHHSQRVGQVVGGLRGGAVASVGSIWGCTAICRTSGMEGTQAGGRAPSRACLSPPLHATLPTPAPGSAHFESGKVRWFERDGRRLDAPATQVLCDAEVAAVAAVVGVGSEGSQEWLGMAPPQQRGPSAAATAAWQWHGDGAPVSSSSLLSALARTIT